MPNIESLGISTFLEGQRLPWQTVEKTLGSLTAETLRKLEHTLVLKEIRSDLGYSIFWLNQYLRKDPSLRSFLDGEFPQLSEADEATRTYIIELRGEASQLLHDVDIGGLTHFSIQHSPQRIPLPVDSLDKAIVDLIETLRPDMNYTVANPRDVDTWLQTPHDAFNGTKPLDLLKEGKISRLKAFMEEQKELALQSTNFS